MRRLRAQPRLSGLNLSTNSKLGAGSIYIPDALTFNQTESMA